MLERYFAWRLRRAGPPVSLSIKAARYGAIAFVVSLAIMLVPVWDGAQDGPDAAPLDPANAWDALRQMGRDMRAAE